MIGSVTSPKAINTGVQINKIIPIIAFVSITSPRRRLARIAKTINPTFMSGCTTTIPAISVAKMYVIPPATAIMNPTTHFLLVKRTFVFFNAVAASISSIPPSASFWMMGAMFHIKDVKMARMIPSITPVRTNCSILSHLSALMTL